MTNTYKNPNVLQACLADKKRPDELRDLLNRLDACQKKLSDYLERKRNAFPRFFFISDDELLHILGSSTPTVVQTHMLKLFAAAKRLLFSRNAVVGMAAAEAEQFSFRTHVATEGAVENWMTTVETEMQKTLLTITKEAVYHYAKMKRNDWVSDNLGMVTVTGTAVGACLG